MDRLNTADITGLEGGFGKRGLHAARSRGWLLSTPALAQGSCPAPGTRTHTHTPSSPGFPGGQREIGSPAAPVAPGCERVSV